MKTVKSLKDLHLLMKRITETTENETKGQKGGYFGMLLGILGAYLLENILSEKRVIKAGDKIIRAGDKVFGSKQAF